MIKIPNDILKVLKEYQRFLLLTHQKPDGDAIGSMITLGKGLKKLNKEVDYYIDLPLEDKLQFFPEIKYFNQKLAKDYDLIIYLDCSTEVFAHQPSQMPSYKKRLVIDHHKSNQGYGDLNLIIITSATAEIIFQIVKSLAVPIDTEMADATFTGISTDTGSFQFSNVTADTHLILSELYQIKDDFSALSKVLHNEKNLQQMKMTGAAIRSLEILDSLPIAFMVLQYETIAHYGGSINIGDDVANIGQNTIGVAMTALAKEIRKGDYRVSLRARYPYDIHKLALKYDGGGHERAAGFSYSGDLEVLKEELMEIYCQQRDKNEDQ